MVDACEHEQTANLRKYVLNRKEELDKLVDAEDSAWGPNSIAPFVPCAASRIPYVFAAARLTSEDVLWDLGCGDGIILLEAASRFGCRCVGLDIDAPCIAMAKAAAQERGVAHLCQWVRCDLLRLPEGTLGDKASELAGLFGAEPAALPPPTVALAFLTGTGIVRLAPWLRKEWESAPTRPRVVTCVESLDTAMDYSDPAAMFQEANELGWTVCRDHEKWGVFVVPPFGMELASWRVAGTYPLRLSRQEAEATSPAQLPGLLSADEMELVDRLGQAHLGGDAPDGDANADALVSLFDLPDEASFHSAAEDALHGLGQHRVLHLHSVAALQQEESGLPAIERKLIEAMRAHDRWGLLLDREVNVRSLEYHAYCDGGSVLDPEHRDDGSLLTLSVLLSDPSDFTGGAFFTWSDGERVTASLGRGDGVLFVSEKRHNVETVTGDRRALIMELWEGPRNRRNRHA